jgi:amidohydrolase
MIGNRAHLRLGSTPPFHRSRISPVPINNRIAHFQDEMTEWRHDLHAHPELGFEEHRTSAIVAEKLASWGIEVERGFAGTGLVGTLRAGTGTRAIGLRADMDALPMTEANDFAHASKTPGKMHGCGHDGHTTMLLGAAKYLAETRNFDGIVRFIFQPAEEGGGGGKVMLDDGMFEKLPVDAVYGVHNDPSLPFGTASAVAGPVQAASDRFHIDLIGKGGHAARPHHSIDPVLVGAQIVLAVQSIVSRAVDPLDSAVVSLTQFHAGEADNVIPHTARLSGTVRTLRPAVQDRIEALLESIAVTTAAAHGAVAKLHYTRKYPPTVNHAGETERAAVALGHVLGVDKVMRERKPSMGGEDFSFMLLARPGAYLKLGQATPERGSVSVHHPNYDFNDDLLSVGASFFSTLIEQELPRG